MASQERYAELADKIVDLMGGKGNISFFTHCVTRLRFNIKDKSKVDADAIAALPGAVGTVWSADQFQVIIGQSVADAYDLVCKTHGLDKQEAVDEDLGDGAKKKFSVATVLDVISGSIMPLLPMMIGCGFIKIVVLLGEQFGLLSAGDPTHTVLSLVGDAGFYFFPVFIGATSAKKLGCNMGLGMLMGAILIHPSFIAAVNDGTALNVFGLPIYAAGYTYSVVPIILTVAVMAPVERFFARISPEILRSVIVPFGTLLVMVPLSLCVLSPVGAFLSNYFCAGIWWLYETTGFFAVALMGALWPWICMTGMHAAINPYLIDALATMGGEPMVFTGAIIANTDQGIASLAVALKTKSQALRSTATAVGVTAIISGIIEPAMYGVNLKERTPMYAASVGSFFGALVAGFGGAMAHSMTGSNGVIGGLPIYLGGDVSNLLWMVAGMIVGWIATFVLTMIFYKPSDAGEADFAAEA